jgi:hypothetical protein
VLAGDHGRDHQAWERKEEYCIEILEREKEQTLKTLWGKARERLDDFFPRKELVDEMRKLHEEHREAKRKAQEDIDMGDAGEIVEEEKEFSEQGAIWARKLDGAAIDKENKNTVT